MSTNLVPARLLISTVAFVVGVVAFLSADSGVAGAYNDSYGRWTAPAQSISVTGITGLNGLSDSDAQAAAAQAASAWNNNGRFAWTVGGPTPLATTSSCYFRTDPCGQRPGIKPNTAAYTLPAYSAGVISSSTTYFNQGAKPGFPTDYTWSNACPKPQGTNSVQAIAMHEFGHALGLGDLYAQGGFVPWNPPDGIMGAHYGAGDCTPALGQDDRDGLAALYGERQYLPSVFSNDGGWTSILELSSDAVPQNIVVTFYQANTQYGSGKYGPFSFYLSSTTSPIVVTASNYVPTGAQYTATIDSTLPFGVVNKMFNVGGSMVDSVNGVMAYNETQPLMAWNTASSAGVTTPPSTSTLSCPEGNTSSVYVPIVMNNNSGWSSSLYLMNTGPNTCAQSAAITITYYGSTGPFGHPVVTYLDEDRGTVINNAGDSNVPRVGSAVITGPSSLVVTVLQVLSPGTSVLAYNAFSSAVASSVNYLPIIQGSNHGWSTGLQIQNVTPNAETVTLYINGTTWTSPSFQPHTTLILYPLPLTGFTWSGGYVSTSGAGIAVVANQIQAGSLQGSSYPGFTNSTAAHANMPSVQTTNAQEGWTWTSSVTMMNTTGSDHWYYLRYNGRYYDAVYILRFTSASLYPVGGFPPNSDVGTWSLTSDVGNGFHVDLVNTILSSGSSSQDLFYTYPSTLRQ